MMNSHDVAFTQVEQRGSISGYVKLQMLAYTILQQKSQAVIIIEYLSVRCAQPNRSLY